MTKRKNGKREESYSWKGGEYFNDAGYKMVAVEDHPRKQQNGYVREHILLAEKALGRPLPPKAQIHHFLEKGDNSQIVLCQDQEYHYLLHMRQMALDSCGDPNKRKCKFCGEYDYQDNLHITHNPKYGWNIHHQACESEYEIPRTARRKQLRILS